MNNQKTKVIIIDFNLRNHQRYQILYCNFSVDQNLRDKLIEKYIIRNTIETNLENDKQIQITMIPFLAKKYSYPQFIWQGYKNKNGVESKSQFTNKFHQINSDEIEIILSSSRIVKEINTQTMIISPRNKAILSTNDIDSHMFMTDLINDDNNDYDEIIKKMISMQSSSKECKRNTIDGKESVTQSDATKQLLNSIKRYDVQFLRKIIMKPPLEYPMNSMELLSYISIITGEFVDDIHMIKYHICMDDIKHQRFTLKHIETYRTIFHLKASKNLVDPGGKQITQNRTFRRPIFYNGQILGLYKTNSYNMLGTPRYHIKHIESDDSTPIDCFVADVDLIRNFFSIIKKTGFDKGRDILRKLVRYDYVKYRDEINNRKRIRFK